MCLSFFCGGAMCLFKYENYMIIFQNPTFASHVAELRYDVNLKGEKLKMSWKYLFDYMKNNKSL